ncbi:TonB-dependent receptor domain-containing protein [Roseinatronobacter sp. S2]|uniref:TonB-dependent receptor domain-containing protein n=1 Tax=Roseinatronobacter sp. S2 TaxID=3035471 RepID=UPI0024101B99|nr:TonB-dependent receptor [Roseinatronobacter sp. S2]WFE74009.1 TonB-dependent receptor [Roseinatronobacter sp. S2]
MSVRSTARAALLLSSAVLWVPQGGVIAQTLADDTASPGVLGTITLYLTRAAQTVLDAPASVTVVDGSVIETHAISDMQQLSRYVPALTVDRQINATQPFNDFSGFNMRGVGGNRVLTLIDGSRVAESITDVGRDYMDFNFVERVEAIGGPASVIWGADALGGVVAMRTTDPEDILQGQDRAGTARIGYDSLTRQNSAAISFAQWLSESVSVMAGLARTKAREPRVSNARPNGGLYSDVHGGTCPRNIAFGATPCNEFDPTHVLTYRGLAKLEWRPTTEHRFMFSIDVMDRTTDVAFNQSLGPVYNTLGVATGEVNHAYDRRLKTKRRRYAVDYTWTPENRLVDELSATLAFTPHRYNRSGTRFSTSATGDALRTEDSLSYSEEFLEFDLRAERAFVTGAVRHNLTIGLDADLTRTDYERIDRVYNLTTGATTERRAGGFNFANATTRRADIYLQNRMEFGDRFELTPGLRYATYSIKPRANADYVLVPGFEPRKRSDARLLASLGALWRVDENWSVWANAGQGFKMPTAQQLYTSLPGAFFDLIPAPDLRPETVRSLEIGTRAQFAEGFVSVSGFDARYSDFIQSFYNPPGTNQYTYRNISKRRVYGVEVSGEWALSDTLTASGSAIWQRGTQRATPTSEQAPADLPPLRGEFGLVYEMPDQNVTLEFRSRFAKGVSRTADPDGFKPAGYGLVDVYATWNLTENASLNFGLTNLFDRRYFETSAIGVTTSPSVAVARQNPLDLRTGSGRVFTASLQSRF